MNIANHNESVPCSGKQDVKSLRCGHEPYVISFVASSHRSQNYITFFSLVIICFHSVNTLPDVKEFYLPMVEILNAGLDDLEPKSVSSPALIRSNLSRSLSIG